MAILARLTVDVANGAVEEALGTEALGDAALTAAGLDTELGAATAEADAIDDNKGTDDTSPDATDDDDADATALDNAGADGDSDAGADATELETGTDTDKADVGKAEAVTAVVVAAGADCMKTCTSAKPIAVVVLETD